MSLTLNKALTEEEKQAKLQELREKLAAKRKLEADKELENVKKNSAIERKKTQESGEIIEELKRKEELKQIAAKRKEKEDDLKAKQRVRAQLEQDKRDRAERTRLAQAARAGLPQVNAAASTPEVATTKSRDVSYTTARLQIRFAGTTKPITGTWDKTTTMLQVAEEIHSQTGVEPSNVSALVCHIRVSWQTRRPLKCLVWQSQVQTYARHSRSWS